MIYTLTTNPAIDMNITSDTLSHDHINRTRDAVYTPNGKGLNVSFTLKHYGVDSTPSIGIAGRYITAPHLVGTRQGAVDMTLRLIEMIRKEK